MATLFDNLQEVTKVKSTKIFYKDIRGRFTSKMQSEVDYWKSKYRVEKGISNYYKNYSKRLENRLKNENS